MRAHLMIGWLACMPLQFNRLGNVQLVAAISGKPSTIDGEERQDVNPLSPMMVPTKGGSATPFFKVVAGPIRTSLPGEDRDVRDFGTQI